MVVPNPAFRLIALQKGILGPGLMIAALVACSSNQSTPVPSETDAPTPPASVGTGVARSSVEGVPVPQSVFDGSQPSGSDTSVAYLVLGFEFAELQDWYLANLPINLAFGSWQWCEHFAIPHGDTRIYFSSAHRSRLDVALADGSPPVIRITKTPAQACPD